VKCVGEGAEVAELGRRSWGAAVAVVAAARECVCTKRSAAARVFRKMDLGNMSVKWI
jgi:hypothetical protein